MQRDAHRIRFLTLLAALALTACGGGGGTAGANAPMTQPTPTPTATPTPYAGPTAMPANAALRVPAGFIVSQIASVPGAREVAALPNGDLIVGTASANVVIVPNAESPGAVGTPTTFATVPDIEAAGVAYGAGAVFVGSNHHVYRIPYTNGAQSGTPQAVAGVRTLDDGGHNTTSVAVSGTTLYVGVGSTCNACVETDDPTRATIQRMGVDGSGMTTWAKRWRNPMALATNPANGTVWAGGAGQDLLAQGHPYEYLDAVSTRPAGADYGWPDCEENRVAYTPGADCSNVVVPTIEFPAYSTIMSATFYPASQTGAYTFPATYRGGLFVSLHGSWHTLNGSIPIDPPHVAFVAMNGDVPVTPVNWNDPTAQWTDFFNGFQDASGNRIGRTTGIAVGAQGSLFVADDTGGAIYRIRPAGTAGSAIRRAGR
ncbi:MAG: hypothetical protein JOZ86_13950 [Candidatus Eremiobacteraeota bacterium]|nr:hypothetical protein [Candidatus Eremiobacteraeota bacterium]